ncbi:MAG TPA: hypothetical protein VFM63_15820 [Pyrinomonadaceae bacterium]|nr:hypothetical protein [Pyrinomonadaceae bacterium]
MPRTRLYVTLGTTICIAGGVAFLFAGNAAYRERVNPDKLPIEQHAAPARTTEEYKATIAKLEAERRTLRARYESAQPAERTAVIAEARTLLTRSIYDDLFPAWYGTPWDFNGTSEIPQQGKIACGYFVSTVLRDAGWKVERVRLAQQASENIILSLTTNSHVKRFRRVPITRFVDDVKQSGPGIYIVGLDIHVGFIVNTGDEVYFIHSSYVEPYTVVKEKAIESRILAGSNYRVLGNVVADDGLIGNWLTGKAISTKVSSN